jgi:hypothetical protein
MGNCTPEVAPPHLFHAAPFLAVDSALDWTIKALPIDLQHDSEPACALDNR